MMTVFAITANGKRMTMRLIDADALRNVFDAMHAIPGSSHFDHLVLLGIKNHIDDAPTIDAVPVVRCRECIYGSKRCASEYHLGCAYWAQIVGVDGYCSNGVKETKYIGNSEGHSQRTW